MPIRFIPQSDDPYLRRDADMSLVKFGHLNFLLTQINENSFADVAAAEAAGLVAGDLFQTDGTGAAPLDTAGIVMVVPS